MVQCETLVETNHGKTNHGIINLIMNEYACYGKGHTIHSSGQIEWFKISSIPLAPTQTLQANQHGVRSNQHDVNHNTPNYEKFRPYFSWVNVDTVQETMEQSTPWGVSIPNTFPMKRHLKSRNPALNVPR